ncbi:MAG: GGDEF domain-containing protein [Natronospirillum sp.]|uniref:diguanylate cyclase n=1 Tax=Natronospirillum sp. TaxID=2812955 RepID=UPI0025E28F6B|nr:diguanylate cyclase [Natronospirillum sp.]MCH8551403.1 GGDEF domain-containing protein [Natronospirillum sp.]
MLLVSVFSLTAVAQTLDQTGHWVDIAAPESDWPEPWADRPAEAGPPPLTGGVGWYLMEVSLPHAGEWVIDFRHSSVIGTFEHRVYDASGREVETLGGGLQRTTTSDFIMRHGARLALPAGEYFIVTRTDSPFYLAQPEPALFPLADYQQQYRKTIAFVLIGLGIFGALAFYYLNLGLWRRSASDLLYVGFILGNIVYNGTALMVPQALGLTTHFYLISFPILVSNLCYVLFVMRLLRIGRAQHSRVWLLGVTLAAVMVAFWPIALIWPSVSLELCRIGVGLMAVYGMIAGIARARMGDRVAWLYLIANFSFLVPALMAITARQLATGDLWLIEHLGLLAVLLEVLLLALVISYQISMMRVNQDRMQHLADHDPLTGCLNRSSLQTRLDDLLQHMGRSSDKLALLFIDLDGFKPINDDYGHRLGDDLLRVVADRIKTRLRGSDLVARIGGDEFVVVLHPIHEDQAALQIADKIRQAIGESVRLLNKDLVCTASIGLALYGQHGQDRNGLMEAADQAMYAAKAQGRDRVVIAEADQSELVPA